MIKNDKVISLNSDTFNSLKNDFDIVLGRTIKNMQIKGASDAKITLKLDVSIEQKSVGVKDGVIDVAKPIFKHEVSSVMQVKDKMTGQLNGDYAMVWDEDTGKFVLRRIRDGQISMFDEDEQQGDIGMDVEYQVVPDPLQIEAGTYGLPEGDEEDDEDQEIVEETDAEDDAELGNSDEEVSVVPFEEEDDEMEYDYDDPDDE